MSASNHITDRPHKSTNSSNQFSTSTPCSPEPHFTIQPNGPIARSLFDAGYTLRSGIYLAPDGHYRRSGFIITPRQDGPTW